MRVVPNLGNAFESVKARLAFGGSGWVVPAAPGTLRPIWLFNDSLLAGYRTLSLSGPPGAFRIFTSDSTNGPPLLVPGQTVTNGQPVTFTTSNDTLVYLEAISNCTADLTFRFQGTGNVLGINHQDTLKVTALGPALGYMMDGDYSVTNLQSSTFGGAFVPDSNPPGLAPPDFINVTDDRFQVWVDDLRRTEEVITADLYFGTGFNDSFVASLYRQPDGKYLSTNMLAVADSEDRSTITDLFQGNSGPNQGLGRSIRRDLGEEVWLVYQHDGVSVTNFATIGKDIKTFTVDVAVMMTNGVACADISRIAEDLRVTKERFAQANIKVVTNSATYFNVPDIVATNLSGWYVNHQYAYRTLSSAAKEIIDAVNTTPQDLCLIYVPSFRFWNEMSEEIDAGGIAIAEYYFDTGADVPYLGNAFIAAESSPLVPPHEFVHIFGVEAHEPELWNLMYPQDRNVLGITGAKRLKQPQIDFIRTNNKNNLYLK